MGKALFISKVVHSFVKKYHTNDPYSIMCQLDIDVIEQPKLTSLKGYCLIMNRIPYVVLNANLDDITKRIVAAHELGHMVLHKQELYKKAPLFDNMLYDNNIATEAEANLFAADLLIADEDVVEVCCGSAPDIFTMARMLDTMPELLNIKIASMHRRGYNIKPPLMQGTSFL